MYSQQSADVMIEVVIDLQGVEQPAAQPEAEDDGAGAGGEEDECAAEFKPLVQLSEVETVSGEEAETALCDL